MDTAPTPNQIVAANLRRAREVRGWTQEQAARETARYLGEEWSRALWSQAERSVDGRRIRPFSADELVAFSLAFERPVIWFLMPPVEREGDEPPREVGLADESLPLNEYLDLLYVADPGLAGMAERVVALADLLGWDLRGRMRAHMTPVAVQAANDTAGDLVALYGDLRALGKRLESMYEDLMERAFAADAVAEEGDDDE